MPRMGQRISDKAPACIHCGFPLSTLKHSESNTSEPTEHRLVIESIPSGSPKQAPAIEIICDITGISYTGAKTLVEKDVVIVKDNITLSEAKAHAERFASINVNFATYHNSVPRSSGVLTMEAQNEENEYIENELAALKAAVNMDITASGGVKDIEDIKNLKAMNLYGAIAGRSLYDGTLNLREAVKVTKE